MASVLCSQSVILGAAVAVSGAVILLSLGRQRIFPATHLPESQIPTSQNHALRSCLSTGERKKKKKRLRVRFAEKEKEKEKVVEKRRSQPYSGEISAVDRRMPENRKALYRGILRDRVHVQRVACSY